MLVISPKRNALRPRIPFRPPGELRPSVPRGGHGFPAPVRAVFDTGQRSGSTLFRNVVKVAPRFTLKSALDFARAARASNAPTLGPFSPAWNARQKELKAMRAQLSVNAGAPIKSAATEPVLAPGSPGTPGNPIPVEGTTTESEGVQSALLWAVGGLAVFFLLRR